MGISSDGFDHLERRQNGSLSVMLLRFRPSEKCDQTVPEVPRHKPAEPLDDGTAGVVERIEQVGEIFRIEALSERGGGHHIDKEDGEKTALGSSLGIRRFVRFDLELPYSLQDALAVTQGYPEFAEIRVVQLGERTCVDLVLQENARVLAESEGFQPIVNVAHVTPSFVGADYCQRCDRLLVYSTSLISGAGSSAFSSASRRASSAILSSMRSASGRAA